MGILDGGGVLLDFATGNPADVAKDLQTAAYLMIAREWAADDPPLADFLNAYPSIRRFGVALHADGSFRLEHYGDPSDLRHVRTLIEAAAIVDARRRRPEAQAIA